MKRVVFRADGNARIGLGHITRSLAMAAVLREQYDCVFAIREPDESVYKQITAVCNAVICLPESCNVQKEANSFAASLSGEEMVVLDGYDFDTHYQAAIKNKGCKLVCIDDIIAYPFVADAVINYTGGIDLQQYQTAPYTEIYSGPEYILLRPPFLQKRQQSSNEIGAKSVLVCLGGSDFQNLTIEILKELLSVQSIRKIAVITGASYLHQNELDNVLVLDDRIKQYRNLDAEGMVNVMQQFSIAICSPSGVAYEYLTIGGILLVKPYAENQNAVRDYLLQNNLAFDYSIDKLKEVLSYDVAFVQDLVMRQKSVFDGNSPERIKALIHKIMVA